MVRLSRKGERTVPGLSADSRVTCPRSPSWSCEKEMPMLPVVSRRRLNESYELAGD